MKTDDSGSGGRPGLGSLLYLKRARRRVVRGGDSLAGGGDGF
jgi:hypothetical protein